MVVLSLTLQSIRPSARQGRAGLTVITVPWSRKLQLRESSRLEVVSYLKFDSLSTSQMY